MVMWPFSKLFRVIMPACCAFLVFAAILLSIQYGVKTVFVYDKIGVIFIGGGIGGLLVCKLYNKEESRKQATAAT